MRKTVTSQDGRDFWEGVPAVSSSPHVFVSRDPVGKICYVMPPAPGGANPYQASSIYDPILHPETWEARRPGAIPGGNRDTVRIVHTNAETNERLGFDHDWKELWGRETGKTAVILGTGPSLTDSLPEIDNYAQQRDTHFLIGFNRAHRACDVDYFVAGDRCAQPAWITRETGDTVLIASTTAAPHINRKFKNRYWGDTFQYGLDYGFAPLRVGLSITLCEAMFCAYKLGAHRVLLYGCDFALSGAFVDEGEKSRYLLAKYYFDTNSSVGLEIRNNLVPQQWAVRGIHGKLCFINYELSAYACYATVMCMILKNANVEVENRSGQGILFWNTEGGKSDESEA
jgi:hypothetical protein